MATCRIKKSDAVRNRNRNGDVNLVARFRRTRKGQLLTDVNGNQWGVEGRDGSDYYSIRIGSDGILYCSCPDYKFRGHNSNKVTGGNYICKHVRCYLQHAVRMLEEGVAMDSECIIYNETVTRAAIVALHAAAEAGMKSGYRVRVAA